MRFLGIETATSSYSVAVAEDDRLLAELASSNTGTRGGLLVPMVDAVLRKAGLAAADVDAVAVSLGPGSFTGVRVALATAKGLALGTGAQLIGFSTLEVLAAGYARPNVTICALLDAGRGDLYGAVFDSRGGNLRRVAPDALWTPESAAGAAAADGEVHFIGEGAARYRQRLLAAFSGRGRVEFAEEGLNACPLAATVVRLAFQQRAGVLGKDSVAAEIRPIYLRRAEAEINWDKGLIQSPLTKVTR
jgi:tRNA threonylcarbamoyladenosine biosynthesis protein TsaB